MSKHIDEAERDLMALPPSEKRAEALQILRELEDTEEQSRRNIAKFERAQALLAPSKREIVVWRLMPWFTAALGLCAVYSGFDALLTEQLCSRSRAGVACSYGRSAQSQGAAIMSLGLIILLVPFQSSIWRKIAFWVLGASCLSFFLAYLVISA